MRQLIQQVDEFLRVFGMRGELALQFAARVFAPS